MESPFEAPSILIEPPEDDNQQLGNEQDFPGSTYTVHALQSITNSHYFDSTGFNPEDDLLGDFSYNFSNNSAEHVNLSQEFSFSGTSALLLDTNLNFTHYRSQPGSPHSPQLSDGYLDDDFLNIDCPSPGAMSDSSYTSGSPYPSTPLTDSLGNIHLQELPTSPRPRRLSDVGPNPTISPGDLFGFQGRHALYNGSCEYFPTSGAIAISDGYEPEACIGSFVEQETLLPHPPNQLSNARLIGHRTMLSEPNFPTNSLLMQATIGETLQPQIHSDTGGHYRSLSDDLLSPETAQMQASRGRRETRVRSRSGSRGSRRSSPYPYSLSNTSQESFSSAIGGHDVGGGEPYLRPDLPLSRHPTPLSDSGSYPGTPIIGTSSEASSSSHNLVPSTASILVMNSNAYDFGDLSSVPRLTPRKVGSDKLDEASNKRRKNEAKHICNVCQRALTTKHNVKNHMKSHFNIKDWVCDDCGKGFTTGHVLKRHLKVCKKRKGRVGETDEAKDAQDLGLPDESGQLDDSPELC